MDNDQAPASSPSGHSSKQAQAAMSPEEWMSLFADLASGRSWAFDELYRRASRRLYGLALWRTGSSEDAGDVVQEVFVRLVQQGDKLAKVKVPERWLLTVTHRVAVDITRRRNRRKSSPLEDYPLLQALADEPERGLDARRASALLGELPVEQRAVIYLHHFVDCSFAAIGEIVGVPTFTAASRYRLGIKKLRRLMEKKK